MQVVFLHKTILLRLGTKDFRWTQPLGIFIAIISLLMFVKASAVMFDSWQSVRNFDSCAEFSGIKELNLLSGSEQLLAQMRFEDCKSSLFEVTGAQVLANQTNLTFRQTVTAIIEPIVMVFFWVGALLFSLFLLFSNSIVIPIEEVESIARPFKRK